MNVAVVGGAGYVGLVTALGLAHMGHNVIAADKDVDRVKKLSRGHSPIQERGLQELLGTNLIAERITFTTDVAAAVAEGEVVFITVDTPVGKSGRPELSRVLSVSEEIGNAISTYTTVVVKSTVPTGAVDKINGVLSRTLKKGRDYDLVMNPEFLREGDAVWDFFHPARIIIGTESDLGAGVLERLYAPFQEEHPPLPVSCPENHTPIPVQRTDIRSAQIIKYAANAFLALRVSFINEVAGICEVVDADVLEVVKGIGHDPRIGHSYLSAGIGFGGPCLEKDLRGLMSTAEDGGLEPILLQAVLERNERQIARIISTIRSALSESSGPPCVGILGLAFKSQTSDVRNSLSLRVIDALAADGARIQAYDPLANDEAASLRPHVDYCDDPYKVASGASVVAILTDWPEFAELNFARIVESMSNPILVDAQNILAGHDLSSHGITYFGVGRPLGQNN